MISLLKQKALELRKKGKTYTEIQKQLGVPKATQSGWFKHIVLPNEAKRILLERKRKNLVIIREKALVVLRAKKEGELAVISGQVDKDFLSYKADKKTKELFLAMLYWGEGFKNRSQVSLGNSDPKMLIVFIKLVQEVYGVERNKFSCYLYLRMDQNEEKEIEYWSKTLNLPTTSFRKSHFDKRTIGKDTWVNYHGVCSVCYNNARIDKRLNLVQNKVVKIILGD